MIPVHFDPHIRAIELRRDLSSIADLIELCFADHMDAEGKDYIHHVRQIARSLGGYFAEGTTPENSQLPFHGYVWVENRQIIGNLTLIQVRKIDRGTYLIANVSVHPDWRGRGIARQLTERAIAHVNEHGGCRIHLQVRHDNPSAIHIYQNLGFEVMASRTTWIPGTKTRPDQIPSGGVWVTKRKNTEWSKQKVWLRDKYPYSLSWNLPFNLERMKPGFWNWLEIILNGGNIRGWTALQDDQIIGVGVWESGYAGCDYVWLGTDPEWENQAVASLLPVILCSLPRPQRIVVNYPAGRAQEAFLQSGMVEENTLLWMVKTLRAKDESSL